MPVTWSETEVEAIVEDYFTMLSLELRGISYNKSQHRRALSQLLNNRSDGSIEMKHQNISAIMHELGMPSISGYKPLSNYQRTALPDAVLDRLVANPDLTALVNEDVRTVVQVPSVENILSLLENPPALNVTGKDNIREPSTTYSVQTNYLELEAANKLLGNAGEIFAINFERARLISLGKNALADKIEHVAVTQGDGAGFDIRSYEDNGSDRFIEVKTTKYGKYSPFFITANELKFSESHRTNYHLHRVFQFRDSPHLYSLPGSIKENFILSPTQYRAGFN